MNQSKLLEKFGIYFDEVGLSKTFGRLFGFFMTKVEPLSMGQLVEGLRISKSTASTELRRLLTMGVIEKVLLPGKRADFYQLKQNIWTVNLNQKVQDIKKLRAILEEVPSNKLENFKHLKEMAAYCAFLETELELLKKKYIDFLGNTGSYTAGEDQKFIVEWALCSDKVFADKMAALAPLGIDCFKQVEIDFLSRQPQAMEEDPTLAAFRGLNAQEIDASMHARLSQMFQFHPKELNYYLVTIMAEKTQKVLGFITFMSGGFLSKDHYKITILAVDKDFRGRGLASILISSLDKIGVRYSKISVSTRPTNSVAIHAYKKWGFQEDQEDMPHFIKGHWIHLMNKK